MSGELFGGADGVADGTPLAERMRPRTLEEVVGQPGLVGPGGALAGMLAHGELPSLILWGPPGCGKTTLARLLAGRRGARFETFSAVLSGVKEARAVMETARALRRATGQRTVLFVDEVHRFNKAQQDAFLPFIETGDIVFVGATTENPSFELNRALLSRAKVYVLEPLADDAVLELVRRALNDSDRGLGALGLELTDEAAAAVVSLAAGDARVALNLVEMAAESTNPGEVITPELVRRIAQRRTATYDKDGEEHYNLISALHKSVRNSDADAALYWLARMLEGGGDPRFLARRLLRIASEDVGMADPRALEQAAAAAAAVDHVGMPECALALAQAVVYLSLAPKSAALYRAYSAASATVRDQPPHAVPLHLRNAPTRLMRDHGYGHGYRYAHDEEGGVADMECLPDELAGTRFYRPTEEGWEERIRKRLDDIRQRRKRGSEGA